MRLFRNCACVLLTIQLLVLVRSSACDEDIERMSEAITSSEHDHHCADLRPQTYLDIQQLTGVWFGNELIDHMEVDAIAEIQASRHNRKTHQPPQCIIVDISQMLSAVRPIRLPYGSSDGDSVVYHHVNEADGHLGTTERFPENDYRHSQEMLKLLWDDSTLGTTEYRLQFNQTNRGAWRSEKTWTNGYDSTKTDVQTTFMVMKAVGNHLVLTQCQTAPIEKLMSITLSRTTDRLSEEKIASVRKLLVQRHLPIRSTKMLCDYQKSKGTTTTISQISAVVLIAMMIWTISLDLI